MGQVEAERRAAAEVIRIEPPRPGRRPERLREDMRQLLVGDLVGDSPEVARLTLTDGRSGIEDDDKNLRMLSQIARMMRRRRRPVEVGVAGTGVIHRRESRPTVGIHGRQRHLVVCVYHPTRHRVELGIAAHLGIHSDCCPKTRMESSDLCCTLYRKDRLDACGLIAEAPSIALGTGSGRYGWLQLERSITALQAEDKVHLTIAGMAQVPDAGAEVAAFIEMHALLVDREQNFAPIRPNYYRRSRSRQERYAHASNSAGSSGKACSGSLVRRLLRTGTRLRQRRRVRVAPERVRRHPEPESGFPAGGVMGSSSIYEAPWSSASLVTRRTGRPSLSTICVQWWRYASGDNTRARTRGHGTLRSGWGSRSRATTGARPGSG